MSESESLVDKAADAIIAELADLIREGEYASLGGNPRRLARAAIGAMRDTAPVIRDGEGFPAHQLVGAPEDVWRAFIDAALA